MNHPNNFSCNPRGMKVVGEQTQQLEEGRAQIVFTQSKAEIYVRIFL